MKTTRISILNEIMLGSVRDLIKEGHSVVIMTKGLSMLPFIEGKKDSVLLVKPEGLKRGDIALAEVAPGKYVLHRVLEVNEGKVILKGDGNYRGQEICPLKKVAGKVKEVQHMDGSLTDPQSPGQMRRWQRWIAIPAIVRRYYLAFYRRIKRITP